MKSMQLNLSLSFCLALGILGIIASTTKSATALAATSPTLTNSTTDCAAAWSASTIYVGGDTASENNVNYHANWWTRGDDPATHNGGPGSGQPWTSLGGCGSSGGGGGGSGGGGGGGSGGGGGGTDCAMAWSVSTIYVGGDTASENNVNYHANWWTRGDDPATHNGGPGSGQPWTSLGSCGSSSGGGGSGGGGGGGGGGGSPPPPPAQGFLFSPYKDATINMNWNTYAMGTAVTGSTITLVGTGGLIPDVEPNLHALTLAFATGTCGSENWGGIPAADIINANIQPLVDAGVSYIVSTGGQAGVFTCPTGPDLVQFISAYNSAYLVGIDFDIEGGQTPSQIANLVSAAHYAESQYPNLRFSFTLATLAASDGSYGGVNSLGDEVINDIQADGLQNYTINLMAMDYGSPSPSVCVVVNGVCEMGQSAVQAAVNLEHTYGIPASHIELTPMIGRNDVSNEIFTDTDVDTVANYAASNGLAGVHFWSLDRDTPCASDIQYAVPYCNSVPYTTPLEYTDRFLSDFAQ